jgi:hypothetical protein
MVGSTWLPGVVDAARASVPRSAPRSARSSSCKPSSVSSTRCAWTATTSPAPVSRLARPLRSTSFSHRRLERLEVLGGRRLAHPAGLGGGRDRAAAPQFDEQPQPLWVEGANHAVLESLSCEGSPG